MRNTQLAVSRCAHCQELGYWHDYRLLLPGASTVELPASDMPEKCKQIYLEARQIIDSSPRGAAALLRLCIQELMIEFGQTGKNLNNDIAELVKEGLPVLIQKSLDVCRVVGNNAVHPGEINLNDSQEIGYSLFKLVNVIVHDRITRPKEVEGLYQALPEGARNAIAKRDEE